MKDIIIGIYKITNKINNKSYIGQSTDIFNRWNKHKYNMKSGNELLYKAFRKYGIENFLFEVIEECSSDRLNEREIYWIKYYNTYNTGYNLTPGGTYASKFQRKISEQDVIDIRKRRLLEELFSDVYKDYTYINKWTFKNIWDGTSYTDVYVKDFDKKHLDIIKRKTKRKVSASRKDSKMTEDIVLSIRTDKKNNMKRRDAYQKYKSYFNSMGSFDSIWYSKRWKEIQLE